MFTSSSRRLAFFLAAKLKQTMCSLFFPFLCRVGAIFVPAGAPKSVANSTQRKENIETGAIQTTRAILSYISRFVQASFFPIFASS